MSLSIRLKTLRKKNNMTQKDVAKAICVSRSTIGGYETKDRQPSHEKLTALAELFQVSVDYLLSSDSESSDKCSTSDQPSVDQQVFSIYRCLSSHSKEEALKFMKYLKYCDNK